MISARSGYRRYIGNDNDWIQETNVISFDICRYSINLS